jgi:hypothetical protein
MATLTESKKIGDVIVNEYHDVYTRERILVAGEVSTQIGMVLNRDGHASGPDVAFTVANGAENTIDAIALENITGGGAGADYLCLALVRGPAIVNGSNLVLASNVTVAEAATNLLANIRVKVIEEGSVQGTQVY